MTKRRDSLTAGRFFRSRLFLIIILIGVFIAALGYARAYYQDYKIRQDIRALQEEVKSLERKKLESLQILDYVTSDAFVEEKARTEFNLKKPGEHVVVLTDPEQTAPRPKEEGETKPLSNVVKWWYYLTHQDLPDRGSH